MPAAFRRLFHIQCSVLTIHYVFSQNNNPDFRFSVRHDTLLGLQVLFLISCWLWERNLKFSINLSDVNEWFLSNRRRMFCTQDYGIARGQTLRVATKKCMAWSCFSVKSSVFGHRMPHFAVILWETEVTNVGALKFQVINAINSIDKHSLREVECEIYVYWIYTVIYMKKRSRNI